MSRYVKLDRGRFLAIILFALPIATYLGGTCTYQFYEVGSENIVAALPIVPRFDWMYRWYVGNYGVEGAQRFLIIAFYFIILFPVQIVLVTCLAMHDLRPNSTFRPRVYPATSAAVLFLFAIFVVFLFFPSFPKDLNTRMGRVVMFTDVKYFFIAALYGFCAICIYFVIYRVGRELKPRKPSNSR